MKIELNAEYICTFNNINHWIAKAQSWLSGFDPAEKIVCFDQEGDCLTIGKDFQVAQVKGTFPVNVYRLIRVSESTTVLP